MKMSFTLLIIFYFSTNIMAQDTIIEDESYVRITANSLKAVGNKFVELLNSNYGSYVNTKYESFNVKYVAELIKVLKEDTLQFGTPISAKIIIEEKVTIDGKISISKSQLSVSKIGEKYQLLTNEQDSLIRSKNFRYKDRFVKFDALLQKGSSINKDQIIGRWWRVQNRMNTEIKSPLESNISNLTDYELYLKNCNEKRSLYTYYHLEFLQDGTVYVKEGIDGLYSLGDRIIVDNFVPCGSWNISTEGLLRFKDDFVNNTYLYKYYDDKLILVGTEIDGKQNKLGKKDYEDVFEKVSNYSKSSIKKDESKTDDGVYFISVEQMPEPMVGLKIIQSNTKGKVYVLAFVNEEGNVTKAEIIKGLTKAHDDIALKTILSTKFKPGKQRGKPVKVQVSIPVYFELKK